MSLQLVELKSFDHVKNGSGLIYEPVILSVSLKEFLKFEKYNISPLLRIVAWLIDTKVLTILLTEEVKSFGS